MPSVYEQYYDASSTFQLSRASRASMSLASGFPGHGIQGYMNPGYSNYDVPQYTPSQFTPDASQRNGEKPTRKGPSRARTVLLMLALWWTVFLVALDQNIISPAIPAIATQYNSWDEIGWYGSAYLLATCALQLLYGSLYSSLEVKAVFMGAIVLFEGGSLLCALAPDSIAFIIGRAIAGAGCAGIYSGALISISTYLPPEKQTVYTGIVGTVFAIASVVGPLLGGAFTDGPGWPWCFYINLPIGGLSSIILLLALRKPESRKLRDFRFDIFVEETRAWYGQFKRDYPVRTWLQIINPLGVMTLVPGLVCLLIALQLGGTVHPWSDARIIALLMAAGILLIFFVMLQVSPKWTMVPHRIVKSKGMCFGMIYAFFTSAAFFTFGFYLPIWFQLVHGDTAVMSGVHLIPTLVALVLVALVAAVATARYGPLPIFLFLASILMSISAGFMTMLEPGKHVWYPLGLQILFGSGFGFAVQQPIIIVQNQLTGTDVNIGLAMMVLCQTLGGAIFIPVAANRFTSDLTAGIERLLPGQDTSSLIQGGGPDLDPSLLRQYPELQGLVNDALMKAFTVVIPLSVVAGVMALGIRYNRERAQQQRSAALI